jgi:hypothetical protein
LGIGLFTKGTEGYLIFKKIKRKQRAERRKLTKSKKQSSKYSIKKPEE